MSDNEWHVPQRPMGLVTIYRSSLWLSMRTAARGLVIALVIMVPLYYLFGNTARSFFLSAASILEQQSELTAEASPEMLAAVFGKVAGAGSTLFLAMFMLIAASAVVQVAATVDSWDKAVAVKRSIQEWFARSFGRPLASALMQLAIIIVIVGAVGGVSAMLAAVLGGVGGGQLLVLLFILVAFIATYVAVITLFRLHEIVADDRGPWRSLWSSAALVRKQWWKVFITLIPPMLVFIVVSEILSHVVPGGAQGGFAPLDPDATDLGSLAAAYRELARAFSPLHAMLLGAMSAVAQFYVVNLLTALYVDLRATRGDFDYDETEVAPVVGG